MSALWIHSIRELFLNMISYPERSILRGEGNKCFLALGLQMTNYRSITKVLSLSDGLIKSHISSCFSWKLVLACCLKHNHCVNRKTRPVWWVSFLNMSCRIKFCLYWIMWPLVPFVNMHKLCTILHIDVIVWLYLSKQCHATVFCVNLNVGRLGCKVGQSCLQLLYFGIPLCHDSLCNIRTVPLKLPVCSHNGHFLFKTVFWKKYYIILCLI
jgi:hypothetical protein